jgi:uncharacterized protein (UPF0332 family)
MLDQKAFALANVRLQKAKICLQDAEMTYATDSFLNSANRSYYCIFHAMRALLALEDFDSKKHSGIIAAFRQRYTKTGIFPSEFSDIVGNAFEVRNDSDYEDFYVISKDDVAAQITNAKTFLAAVEDYINQHLTGLRLRQNPENSQ